jgi:acyl carrier protein
MPEIKEIRLRLTKVLMEALGVEEADIKPGATLQGDLGAESIDFLDIVFRLEREFGIKIHRGELFAEPVFEGDADIVRDGLVSDNGLAVLREQMPYADLRALEIDRRLNRIDDLFTVDLLTSFIMWKLGPGDEAAADSQQPVTASPAPGTH